MATDINSLTEATSLAASDEFELQLAAGGASRKATADTIAEYAKTSTPTVRVYNDAAQSIASGSSGAALAFNQERYDTDSIHDTVTNNTRLTCQTAGKYNIFGNIEFAANGTGYRDARIRLNGTTIIGFSRTQAVSGGTDGTVVNVNTQYDLGVGDYVELIAVQNSGGALNVSYSGPANNHSPEFGMVRVA